MRLLTILLLSIGLFGCAGYDTLAQSLSGITEYFFGAEDNSDPPSELVEYTPEIEINEIWNESTGDGTKGQSLKLVPAINNGKILSADRNGLVNCRDLLSGKLIWEADTEFHFSGGPGLSATTAVFGNQRCGNRGSEY